MSNQRLFKYQGAGNDFLVADLRQRGGADYDAGVVRRLCDRRLGVGADGVLSLLPARAAPAVARMVVHNADGSIAEMCGNGIRCAAKHLADATGERPRRLALETGAGVLTCELAYDADGKVDEVEVSMGPPRLVAPNLPSGATGKPFVRQEVSGAEGSGPFPARVGTAVSMGNPHLVLFDAPLDRAAVEGPAFERASGFAERTNVEFVKQSPAGLEVVVWERGVGLTQACGTGACASVVAAVVEGRLPAGGWVPVALPGGTLRVRVDQAMAEVRLKGPVAFVFEAVVALPEL